MKIEKLNENQIRCTLSRKDLEERHIKLSELAYGSEKAKSLFRDMIRKAGEQFGFKADDIPLMVEAIPANPDTLVLVISKVEYPDELDTRFSKFSEPDEEYFEESDEEESFEDTLSRAGASDILDIFRKMKNDNASKNESGKKEDPEADEDEDEDEDEQDGSKQNNSRQNSSEQNRFEQNRFGQDNSGQGNFESKDKSKTEEKEDRKSGKNSDQMSDHKSESRDPKADYVKVIRFDSLDQVERLAHVLSGFYHGKNDCYRLSGDEYYLFLHKNTHTPEEFNKICNIASEYAQACVYTEISEPWFAEHARLIRKGDALQMLAEL